ncbi:hypothetical protein HHK36_013629 [Tetracentron sinense]|uniref:DUF761 domain-containing protein n=1 Tax=Tetracentron sinense TaxID=13715 RepID=A0A834Z6M4_TETSI|nr:hypothetical protein HHK36_032699 [Tetracentron sinense]KAF8400332.1 hypothetical protein HHK36_013629 [Tetracentron sinense]
MALENWLLLGRLRRAVKKVRFLLRFSINQWRLASAIRASSRRRLSFNDRPGLRGCTDDTEPDELGSSRELQRTRSFASEEDIDKKAEMFIANFYRQLQLERQVSLKLQYCRGDSLERTPSNSP